MPAFTPTPEPAISRPPRGLNALAERFFELSPSVKRPVLFLCAVVIIVLPALLYNMVAQTAYQASNWVAHTAEVKNQVHQTLYHLRDGEAAARTQLLSPRLQSGADFETAMGKLDSDLVTLRTYSIDNPAQQERIGQLRVSLEGRNKALHKALALEKAGRHEQAIEVVRESIDLYPFRETAQAMIDEEDALLAGRITALAEKRSTAGLVLILSSSAQFLLLVLIYLVSERDSRRRQEAEERAIASAVQARAVVESHPDPLAVLDEQTRLLDANAAFYSVYGGDAADAEGKSLREVGGGAWDVAGLHQRLADLVPRNREIWDLEIVQALGGEERHFLVNARAFPGPAGHKRILLAVKDVTARKRTEEQIRALNVQLHARVEQAQVVNQELEAFSYSVSHDLRAPLRHITGFADMLQAHLVKTAPPDEKSQRYLKYILESADQMGNLIDDLLVFSRMGRTEMVGEEVDMEALVREAVRHFSLETEGRKVAFEIAPLPSARGDAAMLRLVWMNLIGNAVKYSRDRAEARIEVGARPDGNDTAYWVRDNGVGFNMKYAHKLFGVFQRLHQADEYEGTGIGLANVRRIVQRHGGRVWAEGEPGAGATFWFALPPEPALSLPTAPALAPAPKGYLSQLARTEPNPAPAQAPSHRP